jgi:pimeloyl-ACP methyl ester carboxylesterase
MRAEQLYICRGTRSRYNSAMELPIADSLIPLAVGLRRRNMLRAGGTQRHIQLGGSYVSYYHAPGRWRAKGPPLLLVHGIADNAATWWATFHALRRVGDVYAIDLPGFGHSSPPPGQRFLGISAMADLLEAFIAETIGRPPLLLGNSMGAWIGLRIAATHPELLAGLIAINPGGAPLGGRDSWQPFVDLAMVPDLKAVRTIYQRMFARHSVRLPLYVGQRAFQRLFSCEAVRAILHETTEADFLLAEQLCDLRLPVGLIWGMNDAFLPEGSLDFFRECFGAANWLLLPATGHLPQVERPREVARFVRHFARSLAAHPSAHQRPSRTAR